MNTYLVTIKGKYHRFILLINADDKNEALIYAGNFYKSGDYDSHYKNGPIITINMLDTERRGVTFHELQPIE